MKNLLYLSLIISFTTFADDFHVTNVKDFQNMLIEASHNNEDDTINVAPGNYDVSGGALLYAPGSGGDFGDDESGLTIRGKHASSTRLNGKNLVTPLTIRFLSYELAGPIHISGLEFMRGKGRNGGGLSIIRGKDVKITNSSFINNTANGNGGGIYSDAESITILMDNRFVENKAGEHGGGFYYSNNIAYAKVTGNEFSLNHAGREGGGAFVSGEGYFITANRFHNNRSGTFGGGLYAYGELAISANNNKFIKNQAMLDGGGALLEGNEAGVSFNNNVLNSNRAGRQGGGIFASAIDGDIDLFNNTLTKNKSGAEGGGAYILDIIVYFANISNNIIRQNRASAGDNNGNDLFVESEDADVWLFNNEMGQKANFVSANSEDLVVTNTTNYFHGDNIKSNLP